MNQGYTVNSEQLGVTNLGKEWRWYKKELDTQRRKAKKEAERKAHYVHTIRNNFSEHFGSVIFGNCCYHRWFSTGINGSGSKRT